MNPKLVLIQWADAFSGQDGWHYLEDYTATGVEPTTVGWMFDQQPIEGYVTVFSTYYNDGESIIVSDPNHLPTSMVKEIQIVQINPEFKNESV